MAYFTARVQEIVSMGSQAGAWISCSRAAVPAPGRYLLAVTPDISSEPLAAVIFAASYNPDGFLAAPPIPENWTPGKEVQLHGPFGRGFEVPHGTQRLALASTAAPLRLLALLPAAVQAGMDIALYCDKPPAGLPASVEVTPLSGLSEGARWADFLAMEVQQNEVEHLPVWMPVPLCPAEVLVISPMPCGGLAACGICAVQGRRGPLGLCEQGPVVAFKDLKR